MRKNEPGEAVVRKGPGRGAGGGGGSQVDEVSVVLPC